MMSMSRESSDKVKLLSFVFSVLVVVIHVSWRPVTMGENLSILLFKQTIARMSVPFFFVISGYFLARHLDEEGWWAREIRKRVKSLVVPYVLWTLVLALLLLVETGNLLGIGAFGLDLRTLPAVGALWYVRCLMIFVVIMPALKWMLDRWRIQVPVMAAVAYFIFAVAIYLCQMPDEGGVIGLFNYGFSLEGLFYFSVGVYIFRCGAPRMTVGRYRLALVVGVALMAVRLLCFCFGVCAWTNTHVYIVPFLLLGTWGLMPAIPSSSLLTGSAFAIFVMHGVVLVALRCLSGVYCPANPWGELLAGVIIPVLTAHLLRRSCPLVAHIMFGGR